MAKFEGIGLSCGSFPSIDIGQNIFGGENTVQTRMNVEAALARVQAALGVIPTEAAEEINAKCDVNLIPEKIYLEQIRVTGGHPLVALVRLYADLCEGDAGQYVHYGTTTQDIMDTSTMLQLKQAWLVIQGKTSKLMEELCDTALANRDLVVMGRTSEQQAIPITLGFRMASWVDELGRACARLNEDGPRIFVGQFGGAVGTLASLGEMGIAIRDGLMKELGLGIPDIAWYAARDRLSELCADLTILTNTLGRIAGEIYNASRSEVNEYAEGFRMGKVGSSTMPHKRNPFQSGRIVAYARLSRSVMLDALSAMEGTSERDSRSLLTENEFLAKAFLLADCALDEMIDLIGNLEVHPEAIQRNLQLQNGLVFSEAVMMALADTYGRIESHEIVYEAAQNSLNRGKPFRDVLLEDERVAKVLSPEKLDDLLIPEKYIGLSKHFVDVVCKKAPNTSKS